MQGHFNKGPNFGIEGELTRMSETNSKLSNEDYSIGSSVHYSLSSQSYGCYQTTALCN